MSSNECYISCSVLQGTLIGVIFFTIYINDLPNSTSKLKTFLFADDGNSMCKAETYDELINRAQQGLDEMVKWYNANKLSIHPSKSRLMIFRPKHCQPEIEPPVPLFLNLNNDGENDNQKILQINKHLMLKSLVLKF